MHAGRVDTLVIGGGNPAYDAPPDLDFSTALRRVPLSIHSGLYRNETARYCAWHIPAPHPYEHWSDARAYDGLVMGVNYGLDKVRFPAPVPVNSKLRAERTLLEADLKAPNTIQLKQQVTIEIEGGSKPACVAEFLMRLIYS